MQPEFTSDGLWDTMLGSRMERDRLVCVAPYLTETHTIQFSRNVNMVRAYPLRAEGRGPEGIALLSTGPGLATHPAHCH